MRERWRKARPSRDDGQTMAEYGLVLGVITLGAVAVFASLGDTIAQALNTLRDALPV